MGELLNAAFFINLTSQPKNKRKKRRKEGKEGESLSGIIMSGRPRTTSFAESCKPVQQPSAFGSMKVSSEYWFFFFFVFRTPPPQHPLFSSRLENEKPWRSRSSKNVLSPSCNYPMSRQKGPNCLHQGWEAAESHTPLLWSQLTLNSEKRIFGWFDRKHF